MSPKIVPLGLLNDIMSLKGLDLSDRVVLEVCGWKPRRQNYQSRGIMVDAWMDDRGGFQMWVLRDTYKPYEYNSDCMYVLSALLNLDPEVTIRRVDCHDPEHNRLVPSVEYHGNGYFNPDMEVVIKASTVSTDLIGPMFITICRMALLVVAMNGKVCVPFTDNEIDPLTVEGARKVFSTFGECPKEMRE